MSFLPSQLGCFSLSSQLGTEKELLLRKLKRWIYLKYLSYIANNRLLDNYTRLVNFKIIMLTIYYENWEIIKIGVPQTAQIPKLEGIFSKFPSQLRFGGEQLFWGTARGVLFFKCFKKDVYARRFFYNHIVNLLKIILNPYWWHLLCGIEYMIKTEFWAWKGLTTRKVVIGAYPINPMISKYSLWDLRKNVPIQNVTCVFGVSHKQYIENPEL